MARCKLTRMNLRNIRKSREYQCLLIDFVSTGVIGKTAAEGLLGYTIPAGLLANSTPVSGDDDEDEETGGETTGGETTGGETTGGETTGDTGDDTGNTGNTVTLVHFDGEANEGAGEWDSVEYTLTGDDEVDAVSMLSLAKTTWGEDIVSYDEVELNPAYEAGVSEVYEMYTILNQAHKHFAAGQIYHMVE